MAFLGKHWWKGFSRRHPQLVLRPESLDWQRARMLSKETCDDFYNYLGRTCKSGLFYSFQNLECRGISYEIHSLEHYMCETLAFIATFLELNREKFLSLRVLPS